MRRRRDPSLSLLTPPHLLIVTVAELQEIYELDLCNVFLTLQNWPHSPHPQVASIILCLKFSTAFFVAFYLINFCSFAFIKYVCLTVHLQKKLHLLP